MPDPKTTERLRGLVLSASEIKSLTGWPAPMVEDYLNILDNLILIAGLLDIEIDQTIEEIPTNFTDGSIPFVDGGFLVEENAELFWDITNSILNAQDVKITNTTATRLLSTDSDKKLISVEDLTAFINGTTNQVIVADNGDGTITLSTPQDIDTDADVTFDTLTVDKVIFNLVSGLTPNEGEITWNAGEGSLDIGMPGGNVIANIPLESLVRVVNKTGSTIDNGKLVYVAGAQGNRDTVGIADNTDVDTIFILGMATEDIGNNQNGYVTRFGYVRGSATEPIDTSGLVEGDPLYLSTSGDWTATHPASATDAVVIIGNVNRVHATEGVISLQPSKSFTIGNNFNGTIRQSVINKNTGISAASGFTAINDNDHFATFGIAGSGNTTFTNEVSVMYGPGYGDHWQAVDGAKDFVWFTDPTDSHNNSALNNEVMRLLSSGELGIGTGTPNEKLAVNGLVVLPKASSNGIKVDLTSPTFGYRDLLGDIKTRPAAGGGAAAQPDYVQYRGSIYAYRFGTSNPNNHIHECFLEFHMPHDYVPGSDLFIHLHWSQIVVDTGGAAGVPGVSEWFWDVTYANGYGTAGGAGDPFIAPITTTITQQGSTTQYAHMIAEVQLSAASPSASQLDSDDIEIDGLILVRLYRTPSAGNDTLDQDTFVHYCDIHYQSTNLATKDKNTPFYT